MANQKDYPRQNYTVLVGYPCGGGHWTEEGQTLDLLEVEAGAWVTAGRLKLTSEVEAEAANEKKAKTAAKESK